MKITLPKAIWLLLVLLPWLSFPAGAEAASEEPPLIALIMETEPWGFYHPATGELQGIWLDIAQELELTSGLSQTKRLAPYARVIEGLANGAADVSYLIRSEDRDAEVTHAGHLFDFGSIVQVRQGIQLKSYDDLQGLRIGVLQSIRLSPRFDQDQQLHKVMVRNYENMLAMLAAGRLDAVSGNSLSLAYLQEQMQMQGLVGDRLVLQVTPVTVQFSQRSQRLVQIPRIQKAVEQLREEGRIDAVLDAWAGKLWRVDPAEVVQ
ncbi:MAG: transporter substrate-binding domain-containing protein [Marinospirillum sp.]|uniref:substrate-binding periplasmic protein n=1 Tax=Marinospirillum sp. TaxID=2183934 RepID=UPI001A07B71D|nr:ABC transporter substrate-binding protein [Marinospirillum sp.]MBE0507388.1 transporter substrate-binding domain-containing protein [Marinospirillum sp.]